MTGQRGLGVYELLLRAYPRSFRDDYGPDMVLLFARQLREESAGRIWARGIVDLALTVPSQHLEHHMKRPSPIVALAFTALSVAGVLLALIGGSSPLPLVGGLSVAVAAGGLAFLSWQRTQGIAAAPPVTAHWWKLLAGGAGVLSAVAIVTTITGEVTEGLWLPMMVTILFGLSGLVGGLILGLAHLARTASSSRQAQSP